jgi:tol-pal system protein YbgF
VTAVIASTSSRSRTVRDEVSLPMRPLLIALAAAALGLQAGCWVPIEQGQAMESDIVKMKSELQEAKRTHAEDEARAVREREKLRTEQDAALRKVDSKVKEVGDTLEALNRAARKTGADLSVDLEKTQGEVDRLRGLIEEAQAKNRGVEDELTKYKADAEAKFTTADARVKVLEDVKKAADAALAAEAAKAEADRKRASEKQATKDGLYQAAKEKLDAGESAAARPLFAEFLTKYKDDALAANAQYWLGECYYADRKWREAVFEFRKVPDTYPKSDKAPDALLKIAFAFTELGLADDAKLFLEEVQRTYPKANAAKLAKEKLAELNRKK